MRSGAAGRRAPRVGLLARVGSKARELIPAMHERGWEVILLAAPPTARTIAELGAFVLLLDPGAVGSGDLSAPLMESAAATGIGLVACSGGTTADERLAGLQAGLDGWIEVDGEPREAVARLGALMRPRLERVHFERSAVAYGELEVRPDLLDAVVAGRRADLTTREYELLDLLCADAGEIVSRAQIHRGLWRREPPTGDRTVDVLVSRIRRKLRAISPECHYLHTHPGAGYRFAAEPLAAASSQPRLELAVA